MPVYKQNKNLEVITSNLKNVDDRYWETHVYKSYTPTNTPIATITENTLYYVYTGGQKIPKLSNTNPVNNAQVALNVPISKLRNGLKVHFNVSQVITFIPGTAILKSLSESDVPGLTIPENVALTTADLTAKKEVKIPLVHGPGVFDLETITVRATDTTHVQFHSYGNYGNFLNSTLLTTNRNTGYDTYLLVDSITAY